MKSYFIHDGSQKTGPFSFDDLKQKGVEASALIWFDGLEKWTEASNIQELKDIIIKSPPPLDKASSLQQTIDKTKKILDSDIVEKIENKIPNKKGKRVFTWLVIVLALVGLVYIGNSIWKKGTNSTSSNNALDSLSIIYTKNKPSIVDFLWLDKKYLEISGKMMNKATLYSYKDFVVEVKYYSEENKLIKAKKYTIHQSISPQRVIDFSEHIQEEAPAGTEYYNTQWQLLNATPFIENK